MAENGFCQCGCGNKTWIADRNRPSLGWIKNQPVKYCRGHHKPKKGIIHNKVGYQYRLNNNHPKSYKSGYVAEHIIVCEKALRKPLPPGVIPHHVNGNPSDNYPSNLVICQDRAYHNLLHRRTRAFRACGHANWLKCSICKQWDNPDNLYIKLSGKRMAGRHRHCHTKREKERRLNK